MKNLRRRAVFKKRRINFLPKFFDYISLNKNKNFFLKFLINSEKKFMHRTKINLDSSFFLGSYISNIPTNYVHDGILFFTKIKFMNKLNFRLFFKIFHHENFFFRELLGKINRKERFRVEEGNLTKKIKQIFFLKTKNKLDPFSCFFSLFFEKPLNFRNLYFLFSITDLLITEFYFLNLDLFVLVSNFLTIFRTWSRSIVYFKCKNKNNLFNFLEIIFYKGLKIRKKFKRTLFLLISKRLYFNKVRGIFFNNFLSNFYFFFSYSKTGYIFFQSIFVCIVNYKKKHFNFHEFFYKQGQGGRFMNFTENFFLKKNFYSVFSPKIFSNIFANIQKYSILFIENLLFLQFFIRSLLEKRISFNILNIFSEIFLDFQKKKFIYILNSEFLAKGLSILFFYENLDFFKKHPENSFFSDFFVQAILNNDEKIIFFGKIEISQNFYLNYTIQYEKFFNLLKIKKISPLLKFANKKFFQIIDFFRTNNSHGKAIKKKIRSYLFESFSKKNLSKSFYFSCFLIHMRKILVSWTKHDLKFFLFNEARIFFKKILVIRVKIFEKVLTDLFLLSISKNKRKLEEKGSRVFIFSFFKKQLTSLFSEKNILRLLKFTLISHCLFIFLKKPKKLAHINKDFLNLFNNSLYFQKLTSDFNFFTECSLSNFFFFSKNLYRVSFFFKLHFPVIYFLFDWGKIIESLFFEKFYRNFSKNKIFLFEIMKKNKKMKIHKNYTISLKIVLNFIDFLKILWRKTFDHFSFDINIYTKSQKKKNNLINTKKFYYKIFKKFLTLNSTKKSGLV